jgi:hypothetical protein
MKTEIDISVSGLWSSGGEDEEKARRVYYSVWGSYRKVFCEHVS